MTDHSLCQEAVQTGKEKIEELQEEVTQTAAIANVQHKLLLNLQRAGSAGGCPTCGEFPGDKDENVMGGWGGNSGTTFEQILPGHHYECALLKMLSDPEGETIFEEKAHAALFKEIDTAMDGMLVAIALAPHVDLKSAVEYLMEVRNKVKEVLK